MTSQQHDRRSGDFLNNLYVEKETHKQHRHELVKNKLMFVIGLFSIGSLKTISHKISLDLSTLLYFIPFVALAYDVYIFSEDFKVKRVGVFILTKCTAKCPDENMWECWLSEKNHRESIAFAASLTLSIIAIMACALLLHDAPGTIYWAWLLLSIALLCVVFGYSLHRRKKLFGESIAKDPNQNIIQSDRIWDKVIGRIFPNHTINEDSAKRRGAC